VLDLDVDVRPCPKGGSVWRDKVVAEGGKAQFPYLVDENTGVCACMWRLQRVRGCQACGWMSGQPRLRCCRPRHRPYTGAAERDTLARPHSRTG
jgi:hypothetical protein